MYAQGVIQGEANPCLNSTQTYTYTGTLCEQNWAVNGGFITQNNGTSITVQWVALPGTQGFVHVKGENCSNQTLINYPFLNVTIYAAPAPPSISRPFSVECNSTSPLTYSASTVADASEYVWTLPPGWTGPTSGQSITVSPSATGGGTISVYAKVKCAQSTSLSSVNINRTAPPLGAISGGAGCFCVGQTQSFSVPAVNGATSYVWGATGSLFIAGGQGTNSVSVGSSGSGGNLTC